MRRSRTLPAVLVLGFVALVGCEDPVGPDVTRATPSSEPAGESSGEAPGETPSESPGESPGESASDLPTSSPAPSPTSDAEELPRSQVRASLMHKAVLGSSAATTPEEKAAVEAWMGYWQAATDAYFYGRPPEQLTRVASGAALAAVGETLARQERLQRRAVGWARDNVTAVKVTGDRATLRDCTENYTFDVDEEGAPASKPTPWYDATGVLEKRDGRWVVVEARSKKLQRSCLG